MVFVSYMMSINFQEQEEVAETRSQRLTRRAAAASPAPGPEASQPPTGRTGPGAASQRGKKGPAAGPAAQPAPDQAKAPAGSQPRAPAAGQSEAALVPVAGGMPTGSLAMVR